MNSECVQKQIGISERAYRGRLPVIFMEANRKSAPHEVSHISMEVRPFSLEVPVTRVIHC